jgi:hypothetical protein
MFDLSQVTTGRVDRPPRIILLGTEKIGKSTFASEAPNPIFMPINGEEGIDDMDCHKFPVVSTYEQMKEFINSLIQQDHQFQTLVIDSSSTLEPIIFAHVCQKWNVDTIEKVGGGFGKGYAEAVAIWQELTTGLDMLRNRGMAIVIIGHVTVGTFNDPLNEPYSVYDWDINKKAKATMMRWADCILFANRKTSIAKDDTGFNKEHVRAISTDARYLYTQSRPSHPGGGRGAYGHTPYELPLDWNEWMNAVNAARSE